MATNEKMLRNFISKYGKKGLRKITNMFLVRESNQKIADEFGVTRQRVHQWQKAFTEHRVVLKPTVAVFLNQQN